MWVERTQERVRKAGVAQMRADMHEYDIRTAIRGVVADPPKVCALTAIHCTVAMHSNVPYTHAQM